MCLTQGRRVRQNCAFEFSIWPDDPMMGALLNLLLLLIVIAGLVVCVVAPVAVLGVMFWKWQKELAESLRLRQARSTQVR